MKSLVVFCLVLGSVCIPVTAAHGDPIVMTAGALNNSRRLGPLGQLKGARFEAPSFMFDLPMRIDNGFVDLGGTLLFNEALEEEFVVNGRKFLIAGGSATITTEPTRMPLDQIGVRHGRFRFTGTLLGFDPSPSESTRVDLVGQGALTATFHPDFRGIEAVDYFFENGASVPEPGTLLLFAAGGAGLIARRRKRTAITGRSS
jgi:hypothetical protein